MRPTATDVACIVVCESVCLLGTRVSCAEKAETIEMGDDSCGFEEPFKGVQIPHEKGHF